MGDVVDSAGMIQYPDHLLKLIDVLKKLPGVGIKSAERFAFQLLDWKEDDLNEMSTILKEVKTKLKECPKCGCLKGEKECGFCESHRQNPTLICVIASPRDVFAIEETREYRGYYHVLGGLLSPLDGIGPDQLKVKPLKERIASLKIQEVVIALDSTLEGDATALFLKQELANLPVTISRLAFGLPMGSSLDYVDGGTLARAFTGRASF